MVDGSMSKNVSDPLCKEIVPILFQLLSAKVIYPSRGLYSMRYLLPLKYIEDLIWLIFTTSSLKDSSNIFFITSLLNIIRFCPPKKNFLIRKSFKLYNFLQQKSRAVLFEQLLLIFKQI